MAWRYAFSISGVLIPISLLYTYYRYKFGYFERRGIPHIKADINIFLKQPTKDLLQSAYNTFQNSTPIAGVFLSTTPVLVILDLELVKRVLVDDFASFSDRLNLENSSDLLHATDNKQWQAIRRKLTPCFWSAKMNLIFANVCKAAENFLDNSEEFLRSVEVDFKPLCTRYAANALMRCVFGLELDNADESTMTLHLRIKDLLKRECEARLSANDNNMLPGVCCIKRTHAQTVSAESFSVELETLLFAAVEERSEGSPQHSDLIQILINLLAAEQSDSAVVNRRECVFQAIHLVTQSLSTLLSGFAHSANILMHCLNELARNDEVQLALRQNITSVLQSYAQDFSYEAMGHMHYLDQVVAEALRKHPVAEALSRLSLHDYHIPGTALTIERNTCVLVPVQAIHYDPNIYPVPAQFDPSRFDAATVMARHTCAYLPFDDGPRNCMGKRLSKMLIKVALVKLLHVRRLKEIARVERESVNEENFRMDTNEFRIKLQSL
ncbi:probable cytochrome P450 6a14 [Ceratitis capitata]|uniref:probable cytochrome P450 6a14 n=1 Tax=Ceratitis capitata TaxID=7213 RepID=UPI000329E7B1|nr:probable cytochrome P450 6a14 [Ceratitis capitata]